MSCPRSPSTGKTGRDRVAERDPFLEEHRLHGQDDVRDRVAQVQLLAEAPFVSAVHAREGKQVVGQLREAPWTPP